MRIPEQNLPLILGGVERRSYEELVAANVGYLLGGEITDLVRETGSYRAALFGEACVSKPPDNQGAIDQQAVLEELGVFEPCYFPHTFGPAFDFRTILRQAISFTFLPISASNPNLNLPQVFIVR